MAALQEEQERIERGEIVAFEVHIYPSHIKIKYINYKTVKLVA